MFWKKKKADENQISIPRAIAFDFGSCSVKMLSCNYFPDRVEVMDGRKVAYPEGSESPSGLAGNMAFMLELQDAIIALAGQGRKTAVVGLSGQFVEGYSSQINYRRAYPDRAMTPGEVGGILNKVGGRADELMRKMLAWESENGEQAKLINSEILELSVDGYQVDTPERMRGERLSVVVYNSYVHPSYFSSIQQIMRKLDCDLVGITPTMYAMMRSLLAAEGKELSAIVLDMGGSVTEVGIIAGGRILGNVPLGMGGESFTRTVSQELKLPVEEAEDLKLKFSHGKLSQDEQADIRDILAYDCKVFVSGVGLLLQEFPGLKKPPSEMFLAGGGSLLSGITASLQAMDLPQALFTQNFRVSQLAPSGLRGFSDRTGSLNSAADTPALVVALDMADQVAEHPADGKHMLSGFFRKDKTSA